MCKSRSSHGVFNGKPKVDGCMQRLIEYLFSVKHNGFGYLPLACDCGHGKYPMSIVVKAKGCIFDLISNAKIPRKKKFYKKDKQGFYYIPEALEMHKISNVKF